MLEKIWTALATLLLISGIGVIFSFNNKHRFYFSQIVHYSVFLIIIICILNLGASFIYPVSTPTFLTDRGFLIPYIIIGFLFLNKNSEKRRLLRFFIEQPLNDSYRIFTNDEYKYRIDIPKDWLTFKDVKNSMLVGKRDELKSLNIVIDPMGYDVPIDEIRADFLDYAKNSGYEVKTTSEIYVAGKRHFCALEMIQDSKMLEWGLKDEDMLPYNEDLPRIKNLLAKKYALMFENNLYQISCPLGEIADESNYELYKEKELMYDEIVSTFRILQE